MQAGTVLGARFTLLDRIEHDIPGIERFDAHDQRLDRPVVVDLVHSASAAAVRQQATRASRLRDPRLARIVATGREAIDGVEVTYVAVEQVPGAVLDHVLATHRLDSRRAIAVVGGAARALAAARGEGLSHGYLRPAAVTVTERGRVVVSGVGIDGEAASQAQLVPTPSEAGDARALALMLVHALTGIVPVEATPDDLPDGIPGSARTLAVDALRGSAPASLGAVVDALSPFDARALVGFTDAVATFPPTPAVARAIAARAARDAEEAERARLERLEASRALIAAETLAAAVHEADEAVAEQVADPELRATMRKAEEFRHERAAVTEQMPVVAGVEGDLDGELEVALDAAPVPVAAADPEEAPADKYEANFDTLEIMVASQNVTRDQGTWELVLEAWHRRWPRSATVARSLARARARAEFGGPLNGGRVVMVAGVLAVAVAIALALVWLQAPLSPDIIIEPDPSIIPNPGVTETSTPVPSPNS